MLCAYIKKSKIWCFFDKNCQKWQKMAISHFWYIRYSWSVTKTYRVWNLNAKKYDSFCVVRGRSYDFTTKTSEVRPGCFICVFYIRPILKFHSLIPKIKKSIFGHFSLVRVLIIAHIQYLILRRLIYGLKRA